MTKFTGINLALSKMPHDETMDRVSTYQWQIEGKANVQNWPSLCCCESFECNELNVVGLLIEVFAFVERSG